MFPNKLCQDYAIADKDYAIVSDGCSNAKHSDVGARILAHLAEKHIEHFEDDDFIRLIIGQAIGILKDLSLPIEALFATLLVLKGEKYKVFGDGVVLSLHEFGYSAKIFTSGDTNMPDYPAYMAVQGGLRVPPHQKTSIYESYPGQTFLGRKKGMMVCSDGILSILVNGETLDPVEILRSVHPKNFDGEFVKRTFNKLFKKDWSPITLTDDFAVAGLSFK